MTVKKERLWVVTCTECPMATNDTPKFIFGSEVEKRADEMREAHAKYHADKNAQTEDVLQRARQTREAMAKSISTDDCQCYCPRHTADAVCSNGRDVILRCPDIPGFARTLIVCKPCGTALIARFEDTVNGLEYTEQDKNGMAYWTWQWKDGYGDKEEEEVGSTDERSADGTGASTAEPVGPAPGDNPVGGSLFVAPSSWTPGRR